MRAEDLRAFGKRQLLKNSGNVTVQVLPSNFAGPDQAGKSMTLQEFLKLKPGEGQVCDDEILLPGPAPFWGAGPVPDPPAFMLSPLALDVSIEKTGDGLYFHQHGATLNLHLSGASKRWLMFPPTTGYRPASEAGEYVSHVSITREQDDRLATLRGPPPNTTADFTAQRLRRTSELGRPFEVVLNAGDALWLPGMWPHATISFGESVGLSIKEEAFEQSYKESLVSGSRREREIS